MVGLYADYSRPSGHQQEPAGIGRRREVSRGPVLSLGRYRRQDAPLRERGDNIALVAKAFLQNYGIEHAKPV